MLGEAVQSVLAQSYKSSEIIIVDDGSTDETLEVARSLASTYREITHVVRQENSGPGSARQTGLNHARGEFIQYLDSDDLLLPSKFEDQIGALTSTPICGAAYGKTRHYKLGHRPVDRPFKRTGEKIGTFLPAGLKSRWWSTSTPLYRRSILEDAGPWISLRNEEDWEYDCRVGALGTKLVFCNRFVSDTRYHDENQLSRGGSTDPRKLRDRAIAHQLIYTHAIRAGISYQTPEMQHFARELFLLARQCGREGLTRESQELFSLSRKASGSKRAAALDFQLYRMAARSLGWDTAGQLAHKLDSLRRRITMLARR
jgi:glycosyltransferase involved in cell wall biosynthesis